MLQLKNIVKTYVVGDTSQDALKGVSIAFRENEFVSVLGQSGSGKTTMLNIIGGLDRYTDGDLVIGGVSTKKYKDADWDYYRNSSIGFVFQSYNLIGHQSVLANVEMALTLAGVSKKERRRRALDVLDKVGLSDHVHKKPSQMSGGQMQRVAIARALINDPDILLADEPTGALDSETSIQIMELLREIAKDKLVIMVTHNPELAEKYSTRIVRLLDGKIVSDTDPYVLETAPSPERVRHPKISMSFFTALSLSFNNLRTKKGRTLLTSFAGSIGIIGIALILALSTGMNAYIADVQKDTMSSYPITISTETIDMSSAMGVRGEMIGEMKDGENSHSEREGVFADYTELEMGEKISNSFVENDLTKFKKYLDNPDSDIHNYIGENGIVYSYDVSFSVYSHDTDGRLIDSDTELSGTSSMLDSSQSLMSQLPIATVLGGNSSAASNFSEMMPAADGTLVNDAVSENYELVSGNWPNAYDETVLVLNRDNALSAGTLCQLGLITKSEYDSIVASIKDGESPDKLELSYDEITNHVFYLVPACDRYIENEDGTFSYIEDASLGENELLANALELKISGIVRPKDDTDTSAITTAVAYTTALTNYIIDHTNESAVIKAQESDSTVNVLTGMNFDAKDDAAKADDASKYLSSLGISEKASFYKLLMYYSSENTANSDMTDESERNVPTSNINFDTSDESSMASALDMWLASDPDEEILIRVYDEYLAGSTYEDNLAAFGKVSYDAPSSISIYTDSFENKDAISEYIERYNESVDDDEHITYTDYVAMLTSSITTIINGISYVLVAFVAISLVVSCIMIGIITHISVMERTKEIGILRALGASRRNISQVFNAETFIIGCCAGLLGIGVSLAALVPINSIITHLSGLSDLKAQLPLSSSLILIAISVIITILGGLLPAKKAAKKDPVIALRSE